MGVKTTPFSLTLVNDLKDIAYAGAVRAAGTRTWLRAHGWSSGGSPGCPRGQWLEDCQLGSTGDGVVSSVLVWVPTVTTTGHSSQPSDSEKLVISQTRLTKWANRWAPCCPFNHRHLCWMDYVPLMLNCPDCAMAFLGRSVPQPCLHSSSMGKSAFMVQVSFSVDAVSSIANRAMLYQ